MSTLSNILISAILISLLSFTGALFAFKKTNNWFFKNTKLFVTFAAGIFVMTSISLAGETFEFLPPKEAALVVLAGFVAMLILHKLLPETHHHHDKDCPTCLPKKSATKLVAGDSIHNIADGIILVAAFSASTHLGIITAFSIVIHEIMQEISEYIVLRDSGYSVKKSLIINFVSACTIFIGITIGIFLTQEIRVQAILLGISAGAFLHIVFHDLIPYESMRKISSKQSWTYITTFIFGIAIMFGVGLLAPHSHEHGEDHEHAGEEYSTLDQYTHYEEEHHDHDHRH